MPEGILTNNAGPSRRVARRRHDDSLLRRLSRFSPSSARARRRRSFRALRAVLCPARTTGVQRPNDRGTTGVKRPGSTTGTTGKRPGSVLYSRHRRPGDRVTGDRETGSGAADKAAIQQVIRRKAESPVVSIVRIRTRSDAGACGR